MQLTSMQWHWFSSNVSELICWMIWTISPSTPSTHPVNSQSGLLRTSTKSPTMTCLRSSVQLTLMMPSPLAKSTSTISALTLMMTPNLLDEQRRTRLPSLKIHSKGEGNLAAMIVGWLDCWKRENMDVRMKTEVNEIEWKSSFLMRSPSEKILPLNW